MILYPSDIPSVIRGLEHVKKGGPISGREKGELIKKARKAISYHFKTKGTIDLADPDTQELLDDMGFVFVRETKTRLNFDLPILGRKSSFDKEVLLRPIPPVIPKTPEDDFLKFPKTSRYVCPYGITEEEILKCFNDDLHQYFRIGTLDYKDGSLRLSVPSKSGMKVVNNCRYEIKENLTRLTDGKIKTFKLHPKASPKWLRENYSPPPLSPTDQYKTE